MAAPARIIWHVETSAGPRFEWADSEEDLRAQLIDYNNDVLNDDEPDDQLEEDATLEEAIEKIEERENFSREDMDWPKVWSAAIVSNEGSHLSVHLSKRTALEWVASQIGSDIEGLDDEAAEKLLDEHIPDEEYFLVEEQEIQA